jgi:hypothetical protein
MKNIISVFVILIFFALLTTPAVGQLGDPTPVPYPSPGDATAQPYPYMPPPTGVEVFGLTAHSESTLPAWAIVAAGLGCLVWGVWRMRARNAKGK